MIMIMDMSSSPDPQKTHPVGRVHIKSNRLKHPLAVVWMLGEGEPAQVSSSSLHNVSKLLGPSSKAFE
ncbi:hypothetical protein TNCV_4778451 [Trichonephila clavipes]|nr:hypothetical protein TNCV_4778451 [Trichonephila clavipes]